MTLPQTLMLLAGLLVLSLLIQPLARRLRLPFALLLVVTGFAASELLVALGNDTGLRADTFRDLIVYIFLPVLIFDSAFKIDAPMLMRNLSLILIISIPMLLLSTLVTAALIYFGIGHPDGFPWIAALLTGALLSATDPLAVVDLCRRIGVPDRLVLLMEGESLFNDATAIVIFVIFLYMAQHPAEPVSVADATVGFGLLFFGGALLGLLVGMAFLLLIQRFENPVERGLLTLISAYLAFLTAEWLLNVSGVMAVLVTGLVMGRTIREDLPLPERGIHENMAGTNAEGRATIVTRPGGETFVDQLWSMNAFIAHVLVFLLMGMTITVDMFEERWLAMLIGIVGVLVARTVGLLGVLPLAGRIPGIQPISLKEQVFMTWGGLRGAVALALALSLPVDLDYWWTIQSIAFGVVLFTLAVQAPTIPYLWSRLRL